MSVDSHLQRVRRKAWLRPCEHVGDRIHLEGRPSIHVDDGGCIVIGNGFSLSSRPVVSHLAAGSSAILEIGDDVTIGHGAAIAAYERVQIGSGTRIGPFVIVMDTNFHGGSGEQAVKHDCRPVIIGKNCRIGSRVTITRGASLGDGAEVLAGSVVSSAIPANACAGGARARVIGAAGDENSRWDSPAAVVPLILLDLMDLGAPPEINTRLSDMDGWQSGLERRLSVDVARKFGIVVDLSWLSGSDRVLDIAVAVERAVLKARVGGV